MTNDTITTNSHIHTAPLPLIVLTAILVITYAALAQHPESIATLTIAGVN